MAAQSIRQMQVLSISSEDLRLLQLFRQKQQKEEKSGEMSEKRCAREKKIWGRSYLEWSSGGKYYIYIVYILLKGLKIVVGLD